MPFGKYKDQPMQDVPADYLHYLWHKGLKHERNSLVAVYIRANLNAIKKELPDLIWD